MKELVFLPGGQTKWLDGPDPEVFAAAVEIQPTVAAVSTGTELEGYRRMKRKTDGSYKPGYSLAGLVLSVGPEAAAKGGFAVGQRVFKMETQSAAGDVGDVNFSPAGLYALTNQFKIAALPHVITRVSPAFDGFLHWGGDRRDQARATDTEQEFGVFFSPFWDST